MQQYSSPRQGISKWWCIGFFIAAIIFFIIGGALVGTYLNSGYSSCYSGSSYYSYSYYSCFDGNDGEFYGGIAMFALGGVSKLIAWILLIIYCVQRRRVTQTNITYVNAPAPMEPVPQPGFAAPQPAYAPGQQTAQFPHSPASPAPYPASGTPPPKEATATAFRYCSQCGAAVASRFCPQCGTAN
ncbi:uncharacterized protein N7482_005647 [Penicillium canariense]|uniref:Zinc-ribbon domain-containing protein n=1 Tax=Penicillium canariense TaxID=189055 RepID=A0A9W9I2Y6_9EURO|nr:uncharacterized protein N7482_005647 [Penicillium canariense]KAJ5166866.1 hypothetical protein N7482_005647 [Penicillium canariense]